MVRLNTQTWGEVPRVTYDELGDAGRRRLLCLHAWLFRLSNIAIHCRRHHRLFFHTFVELTELDIMKPIYCYGYIEPPRKSPTLSKPPHTIYSPKISEDVEWLILHFVVVS